MQPVVGHEQCQILTLGKCQLRAIIRIQRGEGVKEAGIYKIPRCERKALSDVYCFHFILFIVIQFVLATKANNIMQKDMKIIETERRT